MLSNPKQPGFTLLELLIVVSVIAIIAGMGLMSFSNVRSESETQAVKVEMEQLQQAIIRYFADQNSIIDLDGNMLQASPADIDFLINPAFDPSDLDADGDIFEHQWNPDYRKGWRGPYIRQSITALSDVIYSNLGLDGNGDPSVGTAVEVRVKNDPFFQPNSSNTPYNPYLFFDLNTYNSSPRLSRIVSMGADGVYEGPDCDYSAASTHPDFCTKDKLCEPQGDDWVLCL